MKHGDILLKLQKENNLSPKDMADMLGITNASFYNFLKKETFSKSSIALICQLFDDVSPVTFGKHRNYFETDFNKKKQNRSGGEYVSYFSYQNQSDSVVTFIIDYFRILSNYIAQINEEFVRYDYALAGRSMQRKTLRTLYTQHLKELDKSILTRLNYTDFTYKYVIALDDLDEIEIIHESEKTYTLIDYLAYHLTTEKLGHILDCYNALGEEFELYLTRMPTRNHSYMIIDETHIVECFNFFSFDSYYIPDCLTTYSGNAFDDRILTPKLCFQAMLSETHGEVLRVNFHDLYKSFSNLRLDYFNKLEGYRIEKSNLLERLENIPLEKRHEHFELDKRFSDVLGFINHYEQLVERTDAKFELLKNQSRQSKPVHVLEPV